MWSGSRFLRKCMQTCSPNQNKHSWQWAATPAGNQKGWVSDCSRCLAVDTTPFSIIPDGHSVSAFFSAFEQTSALYIRSHFPIEICSAIKLKNRLCGTSRVETFAQTNIGSRLHFCAAAWKQCGSFWCIACSVWRLFFAAFRRLIPLCTGSVTYETISVCVQRVKLIGLKSDCDRRRRLFAIPSAHFSNKGIISVMRVGDWKSGQRVHPGERQSHIKVYCKQHPWPENSHNTQLTQLVMAASKPHFIIQLPLLSSSVWNL